MNIEILKQFPNEWIAESIIPATGVAAEFDDGERYPVLCWRFEYILISEDGEKDYIDYRVIGGVLVDGDRSLRFFGDGPDIDDHFVRYVYA